MLYNPGDGVHVLPLVTCTVLPSDISTASAILEYPFNEAQLLQHMLTACNFPVYA